MSRRHGQDRGDEREGSPAAGPGWPAGPGRPAEPGRPERPAEQPEPLAPAPGPERPAAPRRRTLFVDADACPVTRDVLAVARRRRVPVVLAGNSTQNLERHIRRDDPRAPGDARRGFRVDTLAVGVGADSADFAIVERLRPGDVVVTQDIGLAGMALGRGARAIGVRGRVYDPATIDAQLFIRHEEKKVRRAGGRTKGPDPFTDEDRARFVRNLEGLLGEG